MGSEYKADIGFTGDGEQDHTPKRGDDIKPKESGDAEKWREAGASVNYSTASGGYRPSTPKDGATL